MDQLTESWERTNHTRYGFVEVCGGHENPWLAVRDRRRAYRFLQDGWCPRGICLHVSDSILDIKENNNILLYPFKIRFNRYYVTTAVGSRKGKEKEEKKEKKSAGRQTGSDKIRRE